MEAAAARVTDSHAHLDACEEDAPTLVERAREAGVTRIVTIGTGIDSCRAALAIAEATRGCLSRRSASIRIRRRRPRRDASASFAGCSQHPKAVAVGETGLDTVRRFATPEQQRSLLDAHLALAEELELPVVIHNREADDETAGALAALRAEP